MGSLFEFVDVHVAVNGIRVLQGVSTTIPERSFTVVAGVSGSGKTSLLRLCNRLDVPTRGTVSFRGKDLAELDPRRLRRRVGMVFQRPTLFPGTVRDNLLAADPAATDEAMESALTAVELDVRFLDRIGDDLSGGEAQRACLARALMCRPEVLLMDEPTASLHPAAAQGLEATALRLNRQTEMTVLWVTHDLAQIHRLADHLVVMDAGAVVYAGAPGTAAAATALATLTPETDS